MVVVGLEVADDEAAAVEEDHRRVRAGRLRAVGADRHRTGRSGDRAVLDARDLRPASSGVRMPTVIARKPARACSGLPLASDGEPLAAIMSSTVASTGSSGTSGLLGSGGPTCAGGVRTTAAARSLVRVLRPRPRRRCSAAVRCALLGRCLLAGLRWRRAARRRRRRRRRAGWPRPDRRRAGTARRRRRACPRRSSGGPPPSSSSACPASRRPTQPLARSVVDLGVGGVFLSHENVRDAAQVRALADGLRARAGRPLLVSTDEESGRVAVTRAGRRAPARPRAGSRRRRPRTQVRAYAAGLGDRLAAVGVDLDLAPVLDLDDGPAGGVVGDRSFSADPAARRGSTAWRSPPDWRDAGVRPTVKHFPGQGRSDADTHRTAASVPAPLDAAARHRPRAVPARRRRRRAGRDAEPPRLRRARR